MCLRKNYVRLIKVFSTLGLLWLCIWTLLSKLQDVSSSSYLPTEYLNEHHPQLPHSHRSLDVHNNTVPTIDARILISGVHNLLYDTGGIHPDLNITLRPVQTLRIFYNRIPKCGSTTLKYIFKTVGKTNGINVVASGVFAKETLNAKEQTEFLSLFTSLQTPLLYDRHVNMVDFDSINGVSMPSYVNVAREPLDRMISDYYFKRFHRSRMFPLDNETRSRTFDECVQGNYTECISGTPKGYFRIVPYFCGMDRRCRVSSQWALERAKLHVIKYYHVVGYIEDLEGFVQVLENIFPNYFTGITDVFKSTNKLLKERNETKKKILPSEDTINIMKDKMGFDYDFYNFIKQRFHIQKQRLRIPDSSDS